MSDAPAPVKSSVLSQVFLDNKPVHLLDDPRPQVAAIVSATGNRPTGLEVSRVASPTDAKRTHLHLHDVIDRTENPVQPIYLVSRERRSLMRSESRVRPPQTQHGRIPLPSPPPAPGAPPTRAWTDADSEWKF